MDNIKMHNQIPSLSCFLWEFQKHFFQDILGLSYGKKEKEEVEVVTLCILCL